MEGKPEGGDVFRAYVGVVVDADACVEGQPSAEALAEIDVGGYFMVVLLHVVGAFAFLLTFYDFVPFFTIEPLSSREFRTQRINILDHTAIVFSARSTIDAFFHLCEELRVKIPETMKYFCTTEAVAMYLQKHIVYRKRKIFYGDGTTSSVISLIGSKHKDETFLIATSDLAGNDIAKTFQENGFKSESAIFVKSVSQDLRNLDLGQYDMIVLYNPSDVKSIYENYPDFKPGNTRFVAYGKSVLKAMDEAGLEVAVSAPTPQAPSVAKALEIYLENNKG